MVSLKKPSFTFNFDFKEERKILRKHKKSRLIPKKDDDSLLIATWNIANLGLHKRSEDHYRLIAEVLSWFDIIAIQEVHDDLSGLYALESFIGSKYHMIFNDTGGNDERAAFFYDSSKLEQEQMVGELAIPQKDQRHIKIKGVTSKFTGFDRNPFISSFRFKDQRFALVNAHLYYGSAHWTAMHRRALEAYAIGRYVDLRHDDKHSYAKDIIALGDFNIPMAKKGDPIYDALVKRGLTLPDHSTRQGSNLKSDKQYDQIAFVPSLKSRILAEGVFDYDTELFPKLWEWKPAQFHTYCRYYISDHRPLWMQLAF